MPSWKNVLKYKVIMQMQAMPQGSKMIQSDFKASVNQKQCDHTVAWHFCYSCPSWGKWVLSTSMQSLHMAFVYSELFGWGVNLSYLKPYGSTDTADKLECNRAFVQIFELERKHESCIKHVDKVDYEMSRVRKDKLYHTTDRINQYDYVAVGRTTSNL